MVKRGRKLSFSDNKNSEFFKVYLPYHSSRQMAIPQAFARNVSGTIPRNVILKDHFGRQWHSRMEKVAGDLIIKNGWESFASLSLEFGDFLLFKYDGESLFDVKIFGKNGCIKEETLTGNMDVIHVKEEVESEAEQTSSTTDHVYKQKCSETTFKSNKKSGSRSSSKSPGAKTTREVTYLGECNTSEASGYVVPKNPHFVKTFLRSAEYCMHVSVPVVRSHGIKMKPDMMLCDQNGNKWPVKVIFKEDGRIALTTGWLQFREWNRLKSGDKCVFEFVLGRGNVSKEMKVQIIRGGRATPMRLSHRIRNA